MPKDGRACNNSQVSGTAVASQAAVANAFQQATALCCRTSILSILEICTRKTIWPCNGHEVADGLRFLSCLVDDDYRSYGGSPPRPSARRSTDVSGALSGPRCGFRLPHFLILLQSNSKINKSPSGDYWRTLILVRQTLRSGVDK